MGYLKRWKINPQIHNMIVPSSGYTGSATREETNQQSEKFKL